MAHRLMAAVAALVVGCAPVTPSPSATSMTVPPSPAASPTDPPTLKPSFGPRFVDCGPVTHAESCTAAVEAALGETRLPRSYVVGAEIAPRARFSGCPGGVTCLEPTTVMLFGRDGQELDTVVLRESPPGIWGPYPRLLEDDLAAVSFETERPTSVCDIDPGNADADGPDSQIYCYDGLELGFRALRTEMPSIDRLYLHRGTCAAVPCTQAELDTVVVIGWRGNIAYSVGITSDPYRISVPISGAAAAWPAASSSVPPPVARPSIDSASPEIRRREPYPYCGKERSVDGDQSDERRFEINRCFFDGVLEGRPVEMIVVIDFPLPPALLRFDGHGFITRYVHLPTGDWHRFQGPVSLGSSVLHGLE